MTEKSEENVSGMGALRLTIAFSTQVVNQVYGRVHPRLLGKCCLNQGFRES